MIDSADAHRIQAVEQRVSVSVERGMIEIDENQSVCERPVTDTIPANDLSVSTPTSSTASVKSTDGIKGSAGVSNSRPSCTSDAAVAAKENPADIDQAENKESLLCALEEHSEGNISGKSIVSVPESQSNEHVLPSDGRTEESDQTMQSLCEYQARSKQLVTDTFHVAKVSQTIESDDCGSNGVGCGGIMDSSGCGAAAAGAPVSDADSLADCGTDYGAGAGSGFQVVSLDGGEDKEDYDKGHLMHNNGTEPSSHAAFDDTIKAEIDRATPRHDSVPDYPCIDKQDPGHLDPAKAAFFRALSAKHKGHRQEASMPIATSSSNNSSGGTARSNSKWRSIGTAGSKMGGAVSSTISPLFGGGTTKWRVQQLRQGQQQNHVVVSTADRSSYITVDSVQNPFVMYEEETRVSAGAVRNVTARMGNDDDDGMDFIELSDLQSEYDGRPSEGLTSEGTEIRPGSSSSVAANVGRILTGGSIGALEAIVRATSSNALSPAAGKNFPIHGTVQVTHQHNYYYNIQGPNASTASAAAVAGRGVVAGSSRYKGIKMSDDKSNSNRIGFPLRFDDITDDEEYAMCLKRQKEQSRQRVQQRRAKRRGRARREYGDDDDDNYSLPSDGDEDYSDEDEDKGVRRSGTTSKRRPTPPPPPPPPLLDISTPPPPYSAAAAALPAPPRSFKASAPGPSSSERLSHRPAVGDLPPPPIHQTTPQKHFAGSGRGNPPPPPPPPLSRTSAPPLGRGGSSTTTSNNNIRRSNNHKPPNEAGAEVDATAGDVNPSGNGNDGSDATAVAGTLDRQQSSRRWGHTPRRKLTRHERYELIKELRKIRYAVDQRDDNAVIRFLLSERVYGFPGSRGGIFTNYIQYIYAFHPVISIVMMNKRHPFKRRAGIVFMCSLSFAITASFVLIQTSLIPFLYTCRAGCNAQTLQNDDQDYLYGGTGVDGTDELTNEQDRTCVGGYNDGLDADSYDEYCQHYQSWMLGAVCGFIITIYDALLRLVATCGCIHGRSDMVSNTCCWAGLRGLAMYSSDRILIGFCCFSAAQFIIVAVLCYRLGIEYEVLLNLLLSELWSFAHWFYWALPYFLCKYHSDKKKFYQDLMVDIEQQQQRNQRFSRFQSRGRVRL